jgi:hypothetical protein
MEIEGKWKEGDYVYTLQSKPKSVEVFTVKGGNDDGSDKKIKRVTW